MQRGTKGWKTGLEDISADYHTYALERRDGRLRFYFDDQLTWEKSSIEDSFAELSRHMVLSLEGHLGMPAEEHLPGEFLIDYVRTYYDSDFSGVPEDGLYQVVNRQSKKALDIPALEEHGAVQLVQREAESAGAFKVVSALSGKDLCVKDASLKENAPIIQWTYGNDNEDTNDEWMFVPVQ